jgi:low temperature requirement protein LtrA
MRAVLVVQYLRARRIPSTRQLTTWYAAGFGIAATLWLTAALVPVPFRFALWGSALLIDFATPWAAAHHARKLPADAAHFPERFGLFTLILLGESVAAIMHGIENQPNWRPAAVIAAFSSLAIMCAFWWGYFEIAKGADERHIRSQRDRAMLTLWMHSHVFFYVGIAVLGVGLEHIVIKGNVTLLHASEGVILVSAFAFAGVSLYLIAKSSPNTAFWITGKRLETARTSD